MRRAKVIHRADQEHPLVQRHGMADQRPAPARQRREAFPKRGVHPVTVDRRITPPTAVPERSVRLSLHAAPQYPDAGHAYQAGDSPGAPAFSRRGSVHGALADWHSANRVGHRCGDRSRSGRHVGRIAHNSDSVLVVL